MKNFRTITNRPGQECNVFTILGSTLAMNQPMGMKNPNLMHCNRSGVTASYIVVSRPAPVAVHAVDWSTSVT